MLQAHLQVASLVLSAALLLTAADSAARPSPTSFHRLSPTQRLELRQALASEIRATEARYAGALKLPADRRLYHSIKEAKHQQRWKAEVARDGLVALGRWLAAGAYPGLWTTTERHGTLRGEGFYNLTDRRAVAITLKPEMLVLDPEEPGQQQIYARWKALTGASSRDARNGFQRLRDDRGRSLYDKLPGLSAPPDLRFYHDLGIAGVVRYSNTTGEAYPVLLNPDAIERVAFGDD